eukprot:Gb_31865 [translate_table: standard]
MGNSCTVHKRANSAMVDEKLVLTKRARRMCKRVKSKEVRLIVAPWEEPYKRSFLYAGEPYGVSKPKPSRGTEPDREGEEVRTKIDGLTGSDLVAFRGLRRKDIVSFLERSLSEKEKTYTRGIRRIERKSTTRVCRAGPDLCMHIVTWNMNGKIACHELHKLLGGKGESFDFYVIGLQEVPNCDASSAILNALGRNYSLVAASVMLSLQLFVFARNTSQAYIKDVRMDKVSVGGLGGVVRRQKGAVAITLKYKGISFLFIACHLSPHENNVMERNTQYQRIRQTIFTKPKSILQSPNRFIDLTGCKTDHYTPMHSDSLQQSDLVIWLGDLNYRIEGNRKSVGFLINQNLQKLLRAKDQLSREAEKGQIFHGFCEGPLSFRPTYKYDIGTDDYDTSAKERVPSWTDRILYKVNNTTNIKADVHDYDSIDCVKTSDHRPVKAALTVNFGSSLNQRYGRLNHS